MPLFRPRPSLLLLCCVFTGGAGRAHMAEPGDARLAVDWRQVATMPDRDRLRGWRKAWIDALALALPDAPVDAGNALFDPDRALATPLPPPGRYLCRVYKLGANGPAARDFAAYPPAACHIAQQDGATTLYRVGGVQRPVGMLYPDGTARAVFLGTMVLGDESRPLRYGQDGRRDVAGYVERIGERRWRLVLPYPRFESLLDVVEIVPDPVAQ